MTDNKQLRKALAKSMQTRHGSGSQGPIFSLANTEPFGRSEVSEYVLDVQATYQRYGLSVHSRIERIRFFVQPGVAAQDVVARS